MKPLFVVLAMVLVMFCCSTALCDNFIEIEDYDMEFDEDYVTVSFAIEYDATGAQDICWASIWYENSAGPCSSGQMVSDLGNCVEIGIVIPITEWDGVTPKTFTAKLVVGEHPASGTIIATDEIAIPY